MATDFSSQMARRLSERATQVRNLKAKQMDAAHLQLPSNRFHVVVCAFGLMFFSRPAAALREMWRTLAPGGLLRLAVWGPPERMRPQILLNAAVRAAVPDFPTVKPSELPKRFDNVIRLCRLVFSCGFRDIVVDRVTRDWRIESAAWLWERLPTMSPASAPIFDRLDEDARRAVGAVFASLVAEESNSLDVRLSLEAILLHARKPEKRLRRQQSARFRALRPSLPLVGGAFIRDRPKGR